MVYQQSKQTTETSINGHLIALTIATLFIFLIDAILIVFILNYGIYCYNKRKNDIVFQYSILVFSIVYALPLFLEYLIFVLRLIGAFKDSLFEINNCTKFIIYTMSCTHFVIFIEASTVFILILYFNSYDNYITYIRYHAPISMLIWIFDFIYLLYVFIKQIRLCNSTLFVDSNNNNNNKNNEKKFFGILCKLFVCVTISLISTLIAQIIYAIFNGLVAVDSQNDILRANGLSIVFICFLIDILCNMICLSLQWPQYQFVYKMFCKTCHQCASKQCSNTSNQSIC